MNTNSRPVQYLLTLAFSGSSLLAGLSLPPAMASSGHSTIVQPATTNQKIATAQKPEKFNPPKPPEGTAPGGRLRGGAHRGNALVVCPKTEPDFTALVYNTKQKQDNSIKDVTNVWGYTTLARPTLLFYIPFPKESAYLTELTLKEEDFNSPVKDDGKLLYTIPISLPDKPGVVSLSLPANTPELKVGKRYRWYLSINCNQDQQSLATFVEGVIYRVNLNSSVADKMKTATLEDKFVTYAENGIWYDAIATLAELRQKSPQDKSLQEIWQSLLTDITLGDVAKKPIVSKN